MIQEILFGEPDLDHSTYSCMVGLLCFDSCFLKEEEEDGEEKKKKKKRDGL